MSHILKSGNDSNPENPGGKGRFLKKVQPLPMCDLFVSFAFFLLLSPVAEATNICQPRGPRSGFASG